MIQIKGSFPFVKGGETVEVGRCLRPDCGRPAKIRGLCSSCYNCALKLIRRGSTTWASLESSGKALPKRPFTARPGVRMKWFLGK